MEHNRYKTLTCQDISKSIKIIFNDTFLTQYIDKITADEIDFTKKMNNKCVMYDQTESDKIVDKNKPCTIKGDSDKLDTLTHITI